MKEGRSGLLCFVAVDHVYSSPRGVAIRERQDIVYRGLNSSQGQTASPGQDRYVPTPDHKKELSADAVSLFRYSAVTFNSHRIHYDPVYATRVEGYPALVVQGPFQAALLAEFAVEIIGKPPQRFRHRGVRPLYEGSFSINAKVEADALHLWTADERGRLEKRTRDVAVLVLGSNTEDENGHTLLKNGADEYIAPPFSPAELLNRIHATLKNARCEEPADPICLSFADLSLDATTYRVERNGQTIHLGLKEFRLLQHLMKNPHRVHSRDELQSAVWPSDAQIGLRTVDVHIGRLRGALRSVGGPDLIRTVRSVGYSLTR